MCTSPIRCPRRASHARDVMIYCFDRHRRRRRCHRRHRRHWWCRAQQNHQIRVIQYSACVRASVCAVCSAALCYAGAFHTMSTANRWSSVGQTGSSGGAVVIFMHCLFVVSLNRFWCHFVCVFLSREKGAWYSLSNKCLSRGSLLLTHTRISTKDQSQIDG